jgi:phage anti-repressor protein
MENTTSIDIVGLIENNPISKFNTTKYQSRLIEKLQSKFTNYQQQLFLSSFYCYLKYDKINDYVIDLDNVWKWLGFSTKGHSKYLLEKQFIVDKDYKILLTKLRKQDFMTNNDEDEIVPHPKKESKSSHGGNNNEVIMMNIKTFKKFCLKARTKKADEIHDYFIKLEESLHEILEEETIELKTQLLQIEDKNTKDYEVKFKKERELDKEKLLLQKFASIGSIVYIIRVKTLEHGNYIVKIGESRIGIKNRYSEHKHKYEECVLLDCFSVNRSSDFESFIHNHENIRLNKITDLKNHENEMELFLIGKNLTYQMLLNIINSNIKYFNDPRILELEAKNLSLMIQMNESKSENVFVSELLKEIKYLSNKIDSVEKMNKEILEKINQSQVKTPNGFNQEPVNLGPRLQKINPETMELVKYYESVSDVMKENPNIKRPTLNKAIVENRVYYNYRWLFVERSMDPTIIHEISPTKESIHKEMGYIAKLDQNKTQILNVYIDRKTGASDNGFESLSALDNPVRSGKLTNGFYYIIYDKCSEELRANFEAQHGGYPQLYRSGIGQYDSNNNLTRIFLCKYYCCNQLSISDKILSKSIKKNLAYNGFYYKELGDKIKMF